MQKVSVPKVSVIIPVYNLEKYLGESLDSVINQSLDDIEIICINDGSTDNSLSILEEYAEKDNRIKLISQNNKGAGATRNNGLKVAKGEYLFFFDGDDILNVDMLEKTYEQASKTSSDIVICDVKGLNVKTSRKIKFEHALRKNNLPDKEVFSYKDFPKYIFNSFQNWTWNKLFRREFISKNNIKFQEIYRTNDLLFTCSSLVKAERMSIVDKTLVLYRVGQETNLQSTNDEHPFDFYHAFLALRNFLIKENIFNDVKGSFINSAVNGALYNLKSLKTEEVREKLYHMLSEGGLKELLFTDKFLDTHLKYSLNNDIEKEHTNGTERRNFNDIERKITNDIEREITSDIEKKRPKVSIVIPTYNVEEYLRNCLNSVINQTLKNIEIVCVNDGSTDNSLSILEEFARKDDRIKLISKPNSGYGHTMNLGIDESTGEYIGIVEPDDFVSADMYETLYKSAMKNDVDFIKADFYRFEGEGENIEPSYNKLSKDDSYYNRVINPQEDTKPFDFTMNTWSGIYKKSFLEKHNIRHNESPGASFQDNGFWFQTFCLATKIYFLNTAFYLKRRDNPNSSVNSVKTREKVFIMPDEYVFIRKFLDNNNELKKDHELKNKFTYLYQSKRFNNYLFSLKRIHEKCRGLFLERFHEDYLLAEKNQELKKNLFSKRSWYFLQLIIDNPKKFNKEYFSKSSIKKNKLNSIFNFLYLVKKSKGNPKTIYNFLKAFRRIKELKLFDEKYYMRTYPELNLSHMTPLNHYIFHGFKENKLPSYDFDGVYYLKQNKDVAKTGENPLVHYVLHGKEEGRNPNEYSY